MLPKFQQLFLYLTEDVSSGSAFGAEMSSQFSGDNYAPGDNRNIFGDGSRKRKRKKKKNKFKLHRRKLNRTL